MDDSMPPVYPAYPMPDAAALPPPRSPHGRASPQPYGNPSAGPFAKSVAEYDNRQPASEFLESSKQFESGAAQQPEKMPVYPTYPMPTATLPPPPSLTERASSRPYGNPSADPYAETVAEPRERQPASKFFESLKQFESGAAQQPEKALSPATKPWAFAASRAKPLGPIPPPPASLDFGPATGEGPEPRAAGGIGHPGHIGRERLRARLRGPPRRSRAATVASVRDGGIRLPGRVDTETVITRPDLVYDPSKAKKNTAICLELDTVEDWEDDLDAFCRLKRLGLIREAKKYFRSALEHLSTIPYIRVQYAEMLLSAGHYRELQNLEVFPDFSPEPWVKTPQNNRRQQLVFNHDALDFLSQRPMLNYVTRALDFVHDALRCLATEPLFGSTEFQLLSLCLRILARLQSCADGVVVVGPEQAYAKRKLNWHQLYHDLVSEGCIWDLRDLFMAAVPVFGWEQTLSQFFGISDVSRMMDILLKDWSRPSYDESCVMGLLDLLTSIILQDHSDTMKTRNSVLLHHAKALADSVERNNAQLMMSKPFIQWLLARCMVEMERPSERAKEHLDKYGGQTLDQGAGIHLPIFVPSRYTGKPVWNLFQFQSSPMQRRAVEVAIRAAEELGDCNLQALAMKVLILQSQDPKPWITALASLQSEVQGDREGHLATRLSSYLAITEPREAADLVEHLRELDLEFIGEFENTRLAWARVMIRFFLIRARSDDVSLVTNLPLKPTSSTDRSSCYSTGSLFPSGPVAKNQTGIVEELTGESLDSDASRRVRREGEPGKRAHGQQEIEAQNQVASWIRSLPPEVNGNVQPTSPPRGPSVHDSQWLVPPIPVFIHSDPKPESSEKRTYPPPEVRGGPSTRPEDTRRRAGDPRDGAEGADRVPSGGQDRESTSRRARHREGAEGEDGFGGRGERDEASNDDSPMQAPLGTARNAARSRFDADRHADDEIIRMAGTQRDKEPVQQRSRPDPRRKARVESEDERIGEAESCQDGHNKPEVEEKPRDDSQQSPQINFEGGVAKINLPGDVLDDVMTVLLTDKLDSSKVKKFVLRQAGPVETMPSGGSRRHEQDVAPPGPDKSGLETWATSAQVSDDSAVEGRRRGKTVDNRGADQDSKKPVDGETGGGDMPGSQMENEGDRPRPPQPSQPQAAFFSEPDVTPTQVVDDEDDDMVPGSKK